MPHNVIQLDFRDDEVVCDYGIVNDWMHTDYHPKEGPGRSCFHAVTPLPTVLLFGREHIARYNFQPVAYYGPRWPAIISRRGDIVTLAFDRTGPTDYCTCKPRRPNHRWQYRLHPVQWWDDDQPCEACLAGVWVD